MYIRIRRLKTSVFLHVEPTDKVTSVKDKIEELLQYPRADQQIYKDGTRLDDSKTLSELKIESDDALTLALKKDDGTWESPQVVEFDDENNDEG